MSGVNTLFNGLTNEVWFTDSPPKNLKFAPPAAWRCRPRWRRSWEEITGKPVLQGYGLTETSPVLTFNPLGQGARRLHRRARPLDRHRLPGRRRRPGAAGRAGRDRRQGPAGHGRLLAPPDETAKVMKDGWFLTGDIGVMDADGYFTIVDRKKDMVVVSGFNVYPNEVEDCLATHPGILESR
jgi:long-chain acyl-CoA synthetase